MHRTRARSLVGGVVLAMALAIGVGLLLQGGAPPSTKYRTLIEPFVVEGPTGNAIYGQVRRPDDGMYPGQRFAAVILVPGGINPGRMEVHGQEARILAEAGMAVFCFNAEGRVDVRAADDLRSEGEEDFNGHRHQDGLAAIVRFVADQDYVLPDNIGLRSQSYGITMAAGCAGRHPDLPIRYIVDGEGPPSSFVTCHGPRFLAGDMRKYDTVKAIFGRLATWQDPSEENTAWWAEREAVRFIGAFQGAYLRLQATWDHAQPPEKPADVSAHHHPDGWPGGGPAWYHNKHTNDLVNAAIAGGVPWVRINLAEHGNEVGATYGVENKPMYLPGKLSDQPWGARAVLEMAGDPIGSQ